MTRALLALAMVAAIAPAAAQQVAAPQPAVPFEHAAEHTIASRPELRLLWLPAATNAADARPVIVALHGCGGLYTAKGALGWLAARSDVDARHVALMGWSHGGSTLLRTIDTPAWPLAPVAAIAMYPGCADALKRRSYAPAVPLLLMVGADDDWTPPQPCAALAQRLQAAEPAQAQVQFVSYAGSYHGFDRRSPVRWLEGVPNGVDGRGVHVGGNPAARADALPRIQAFLVEHLTK